MIMRAACTVSGNETSNWVAAHEDDVRGEDVPKGFNVPATILAHIRRNEQEMIWSIRSTAQMQTFGSSSSYSLQCIQCEMLSRPMIYSGSFVVQPLYDVQRPARFPGFHNNSFSTMSNRNCPPGTAPVKAEYVFQSGNIPCTQLLIIKQIPGIT